MQMLLRIRMNFLRIKQVRSVLKPLPNHYRPFINP
jgi:hypothetical protein